LTEVLAGKSRVDAYLFSEFGGVVVEISAERWPSFERLLAGHGAPWVALGETTGDGTMIVHWQNGRLDLTLSDAENAQRNRGRCNALFA